VKFEWSFNRQRCFAILTVVLSTTLTLAAAELFLRLRQYSPEYDRVTLEDPDLLNDRRTADCYPRAPGFHLPIDLAEPRGREMFLRVFPTKVESKMAGNFFLGSPMFKLRDVGMRSETAVDVLAQSVPFCVIYEHSLYSDRHQAKVKDPKDRIAFLGDSFVYGQGITVPETLTQRLSAALDADIVSVATPGANISEILDEFETVVKGHQRLHSTKVIYFYVLNDPYMSKDLLARLNYIDDLMNIRFYKIGKGYEKLIEFVSSSVLVRLLLLEYSRLVVSDKMLAWYREANDPVANPQLLDTFKAIRGMRDRARSLGMDFIMMVYPLMLDMDHYPLLEAHKNLRELASREGIEFHDLLPAFQREAKGRSLVVHPVDYHPNGLAQEIAAREVAGYLRERKGKHP
jgi:hypothetical protein